MAGKGNLKTGRDEQLHCRINGTAKAILRHAAEKRGITMSDLIEELAMNLQQSEVIAATQRKRGMRRARNK